MAIIYVDGSGFSGNSSAYCIFYKNSNKPILKVFYENHSALFMETLVLRDCLIECEKNSTIYTDCKILTGYVLFGWQTHLEELKPLIKEIKNLIKEKNCNLIWLNRYNNKAGKYLEHRNEMIRNYKKACTFSFRRKRW